MWWFGEPGFSQWKNTNMPHKNMRIHIYTCPYTHAYTHFMHNLEIIGEKRSTNIKYLGSKSVTAKIQPHLGDNKRI